MRILHLILHKKWFDMIRSGEKDIEYRALTMYWNKRLREPDGSFKDFDIVRFRNGYAKNAPQFDAEFILTETSYPQRGWCEKGSGNKICFCIHIGQIQNEKNITN